MTNRTTSKLTSKIALVGVSAFLGLILVAPAVMTGAYAANAQFNKTPTLSTNSETYTISASGKATGLGNTPTSAFLTADTVLVEFHCINNGGNFAPGHPASSDDVVGPTKNFQPRNGQITFSGVTLQASTPSAADECPSHTWDVVVDSVTFFGVTLHIQQAGTDILTFAFGDVSL